MPETALEMAERHIRQGAERIARQRALIGDLKAHGQSGAMVAEAETLLAEFVTLQKEYEAHRDWLAAKQ